VELCSLRTFFLAAVFACCAGLPGHAGAPGEDQAGQPLPGATANPAAGGDGTTAAAPKTSRLTCRRYFGCLPSPRSAAHSIED